MQQERQSRLARASRVAKASQPVTVSRAMRVARALKMPEMRAPRLPQASRAFHVFRAVSYPQQTQWAARSKASIPSERGGGARDEPEALLVPLAAVGGWVRLAEKQTACPDDI